MPVFKHVLKRVALVLAGYFVGVITALVAVVFLYAILSSLPGAPGYFDAMGVSVVFMILAPPIALFVIAIAVVATGAQALVTATISEIFELRSVLVHMLFGAATASSGFVLVSPTLDNAISPTDWADIGIVAASGAIGGIAYWLIAGRGAGIRPGPEY